MARVIPLEPPYALEVHDRLHAVMPVGVPPLILFRTLAVSERAWSKLTGGSLLDKGPLSLREREIAIIRTCARAECEYEWGVHVAWFAQRVGLGDAHIRALLHARWDAPCWTPREQALLRAADCLFDANSLSQEAFDQLQASYRDDEILEIIQLCGFYRTIAYLAGSLALPLEDWATRFDDYPDTITAP